MLIEDTEGYLRLIEELKREPNDENVERAIVAITELFGFYQKSKEDPFLQGGVRL